MIESSFWGKLSKPFFALAPMADVTDVAFRRIIAKYGKPDILWTEFVSADGLILADAPGRARLLSDLGFTEAERPIVAQLFTACPEIMEQAAALILKLGFDGLDINMGCPDRQVEKQGSGAALIKDPRRAREIIRAARLGGGSKLPISVKTRLGYNRDELETWLPELLAEEPSAVTIHARTRKEMSKVPAHWERIARAVAIRDASGSRSLIIGNGDVSDLAEAKRRAVETQADGIMLGRAIFGRPWLFAGRDFSLRERLEILAEHTALFEKLLGETKSFAVMKKHFKSYLSGFPGAGDLRARLMETNSAAEVKRLTFSGKVC